MADLTVCAAVLTLGLVIVVPAGSKPQKKDITIRAVTYDELSKEIVKHRGKVVVVDCWFVGCPPCYECMQHLVKMQKKHAAEGMLAITVCINILDDQWPKYEKAANAVLRKLGVTSRNRLLKVSFDEAAKKMHLPGSFPTVVVFNRRGKWRQFSDDGIRGAMDAWILRCLQEK